MLTDAERSFLDALPDGAFEVEDVLYCQVQRDHAGPHLANGQDSGSDEWWLRWDDTNREAICLPGCPVTRGVPDGAGEGLCLLPANHDGRHSFDLQPMP